MPEFPNIKSTQIQRVMYHNILQNETDFLILHGIGDIGKSELAKHYALSYAKDYDAAVFVRFQGNMIDTVTNDIAVPVVNCQRGEDEFTSGYYSRKLQIHRSSVHPDISLFWIILILRSAIVWMI